MSSCAWTPRIESDYRESSGRQVGITVTPKKEMCVRCETMRTEATGEHTGQGFVCHGCLRRPNQAAKTETGAFGGVAAPAPVL